MTIAPCEFMEPELSPENEKAVWLFSKIQNILWDGFGGVNVDAIKYVIELYEVPKEEQQIMFEKIVRFAEQIKKQGDTKDSGGKQDRNKTDRKRRR